MLRKIVIILLAGFALQASGTEKLPNDVRFFIEDREGCDQMRGEIPSPLDKQRMREVSLEIDKLCKGTDQRLAGLKRKYASNGTVMRHLNRFEIPIEASSNVRNKIPRRANVNSRRFFANRLKAPVKTLAGAF
jgi:hypothetical protein